jgi:hypothetical protein
MEKRVKCAFSRRKTVVSDISSQIVEEKVVGHQPIIG